MGFVGDIIGAEGAADSAAMMEAEARKWDDLATGTPEEWARKAKALFDSGYLTPEQYQAELQGPSSLESYKVDPRLRNAQYGSLGQMQDIAKQGGLTAIDKARLQEIALRNLSQARGQREAIKQNAAARGVGGSGLELAAALQGQSDAATRGNMEGLSVAADAEQRALQAIRDSASMAGNIRGQEGSEAQARAAAQDAINRFNVQNRNVASAGNIDARNRARMAALELQRQEVEDRIRKRQGATSAITGAANYNTQAAQGYGNAVGGGLETVGSLFAMSDINAKENIEPAEGDLDEFLSNLKPSSWEYKDPEKYGEGRKYGVMAQDMEKSPVGKSFVSTDKDGVKRIDYGAAQGAMLAIIKDMNDRLKGVEGARG
jgi:hypothetical protein